MCSVGNHFHAAVDLLAVDGTGRTVDGAAVDVTAADLLVLCLASAGAQTASVASVAAVVSTVVAAGAAEVVEDHDSDFSAVVVGLLAAESAAVRPVRPV